MIVYLFAQVESLTTSLTCVITTLLQLSVTVRLPGLGAGTFAAQLTVILAGHVITGVSVSLTVTLKEHVSPVSGVVTVTMVVPTGKKVPDACEYSGVPQSPEVNAGKYSTIAPHCPASLFTVILSRLYYFKISLH